MHESLNVETTREPWISIGEACRILGVSEATLRQWTDDGQIKVFITPGGHRRYDRTQLDDFMASRQKKLGMKDLVARLEGTVEPHREIGAGFFLPESDLRLSDAQRHQLAVLGRGILDLIINYVADPSLRDDYLRQARAVGREFGFLLADAGLNLTGSIQAFISHRKPIVEGVMAMMRQKEIIAEDILAALPLIDNIMDQTLVALVEAHQQKLQP